MKIECKKCDEYVEPVVKERKYHNTAYCSLCGKYIKHLSKSEYDGPFTPDNVPNKPKKRETAQQSLFGGTPDVPEESTLPALNFGRNQGIPIYEFDSEDLLSYLKWMIEDCPWQWNNQSEITRAAVIEKLKEHDYQVDFT